MVSFQEVLIFLDISVRNFFSIVFPLTTEIPWESVFHKVIEHFRSVWAVWSPSVPPLSRLTGHLLELLWRTAVGGGTIYPNICRC